MARATLPPYPAVKRHGLRWPYLLAEPRLLLLDEPFAKLDASLRQTIRTEVFTQIERHQLPALLVTHDPEDARQAKGPVYEIQNQRLRRID